MKLLRRWREHRQREDRQRRRHEPSHIRGHLEDRICTDHGAHGIADDEPVTFTEAQAMR